MSTAKAIGCGVSNLSIIIVVGIVILRRLSRCSHSILLHSKGMLIFLGGLLTWQEVIGQVLDWRTRAFIVRGSDILEAEVINLVSLAGILNVS